MYIRNSNFVIIVPADGLALLGARHGADWEKYDMFSFKFWWLFYDSVTHLPVTSTKTAVQILNLSVLGVLSGGHAMVWQLPYADALVPKSAS